MKSVSADPTPTVEAATGAAPLGHDEHKPTHEHTADEEADIVDWERVAATEDFRALITAKLRFIAPATVFFIVYYFTLPLLVGYAPRLMETKVFGVVNLAYLFALSQFFMAWILAALYLRAAGRFDSMTRAFIAKLGER